MDAKPIASQSLYGTLPLSRPAFCILHSAFYIHLRESLNINIEYRDNRAVYIKYDRMGFSCNYTALFRAKIQRRIFPPFTNDTWRDRRPRVTRTTSFWSQSRRAGTIICCTMRPAARLSLVIGNEPLSVSLPRKSLVCLFLGAFIGATFGEFLGVCSVESAAWVASEFRRASVFRNG